MGKKYIELKWKKLNCLEQNGFITGYSVLYTRIMPQFRRRNQHSEVRTPSTKVILGPLDPGTNYSITVAAFNMEGVGPYSPNIHVRTRIEGKCMLDFLRMGSIKNRIIDTVYELVVCMFLRPYQTNNVFIIPEVQNMTKEVEIYFLVLIFLFIPWQP